MEILFTLWTAILYYQSEQYALFALLIAIIVIPSLVLTFMSMVWYYDQDKLYNTLLQSHPDDFNLKRYKNLIKADSMFFHITLLGQLYRYGQVIYLLLRRSKDYDVDSLYRDSSLIRFFHGLLISAPLLVIQLYSVSVTVVTDPPVPLRNEPYPIVSCAIVTGTISLSLTLLLYTLTDRLHADKRRVVIPAYITMFLWNYLTMASRIISLVLFALAYGPYVTVVIFIHWIGCVIWTLAERTNMCGDTSKTPPKKRWHLEVPFTIVVSFGFLFLYYNIHNGPTLARIIVYYLLTTIETVILVGLFIVVYPDLDYTPWVGSITMALYLLGLSAMLIYFIAWHPTRTSDCCMIGCPRSKICCIGKEEDNGMGNVDLPLSDEGNLHRTRGGTLEGAETGSQLRAEFESQSRAESRDHVRAESIRRSPYNNMTVSEMVEMGGAEVTMETALNRATRHNSMSLHDRNQRETWFIPTVQPGTTRTSAVPYSTNNHYNRSRRLTEPNIIHPMMNNSRRYSIPVNLPVIQISSVDVGEDQRPSSRLSTISTPAYVNATIMPMGPTHVPAAHSHYATPNPTHLEPAYYNRMRKSMSEATRRHGNNQSPVHHRHGNHSPAHRPNIYATPRRTHQAISEHPQISENRRGSHSAHATPFQSPYVQRRRKTTNPLHTHDPMVEFVQLYSSNPTVEYNRMINRHSDTSRTSGEDTAGPNRCSTSSSYVYSSDNRSDLERSLSEGPPIDANRNSMIDNISTSPIPVSPTSTLV
jgi:hypothetical protein